MKFLITEAFKPDQDHSCIYLLDSNKNLQHIDYTPERFLVQPNKRANQLLLFPPEICDSIIKILIDTALDKKQITLALEYIFINKYHLKSFYTRFFPNFKKSTLAYINRVSAMLNLFRDTDDWLIDAEVPAQGFHSLNIDLGSNLYHLEPWSYDGYFSTWLTAQPTVLFSKSYKDIAMNQTQTGPYHTQIVWLGGTVRHGIIDVKYYKNPIIIYTLCHLPNMVNEEELEVDFEYFTKPQWVGFGNLARLIFGQNSGIFFQVSKNLPDEFVFSSPVVFEL